MVLFRKISSLRKNARGLKPLRFKEKQQAIATSCNTFPDDKGTEGRGRGSDLKNIYDLAGKKFSGSNNSRK
ncbi:hypothetical protein DXX99_06035 [Ammonifex thiophilus]|uniref:Uncharacterized protein n=1 Tax=Ammonifex thiophilus TaxID=444093 RepID=A0A3D8P4R7_9THEO|nr:hypothetical protein DXX99_06035 [Ammonifex thiophilus]